MITTLSLSPAVDKIYYVENFEPGKLYRVKNMVKSAGGKGINVARVSSLLGEKVRSVGFKAGETGRWLEQQLKDLDVRTHFIEVAGESRTNNNIIDTATGLETEVLEIGPVITCKDKEKFFEIFSEALESTDVLVCSGGLPEGIPADFYKSLIEIAGGHGVRTVLDTSNEVLEEGIKARPFLVKPNLRELQRYAGKPLDTLDEIVGACREINAIGIKMVVASMGGDGALLVSDEQVLYAKAPKVDVVNTIGSGDSMVAGLTVGLFRNYPAEEMFGLGMACAVTNTQYKEVGVIDRETVEKYRKEITVERI